MYSPFLLAVKRCDIAIVRFLLTKCGADVNQRKSHGESALHVLCKQNDWTVSHSTLLNLLVQEAGADVQLLDDSGLPPAFKFIAANNPTGRGIAGTSQWEYMLRHGAATHTVLTQPDQKSLWDLLHPVKDSRLHMYNAVDGLCMTLLLATRANRTKTNVLRLPAELVKRIVEIVLPYWKAQHQLSFMNNHDEDEQDHDEEYSDEEEQEEEDYQW